MRFLSSSLFLLIGMIFISTACQPRPKPPQVKQGVAVAKVGDAVITDEILTDRIREIEKTFPRVYSAHEQKKALLSEMMNIELLYEEALKQHLNERFDFKSRLADLYVRKLSEAARAQITDERVQKYFEDNRVALEQVSARHILLKFPDKNTPAAKKAELKKKLEGIRAEAIKTPDRFGELAYLNSEDGSKNNRGDLGFFGRSMMVKPFADAAFALKKVGDISPIVETEFGYHIIQLSGDRRNIDQFKEQIKDQLVRSSQRAILDDEIAKLKKGKPFEIFEDNLAKLSPLPVEVTTPPEKLIPEKSKPEAPAKP